MLAFISAVFVSAISGILSSIFKNTALAAVFKKTSPEQKAVNTEEEMAQTAVDTPDKSQAIKDLEDGAI